MRQARLHSPRLDLMPLGGERLEFEVLLESNPEVRRYLGNGMPRARLEAEVGNGSLPQYWRQGLAGAGACELIRHGFADLGLVRIYSETMTVNSTARATLDGIGMDHIRTCRPRWKHLISGAEHGEVEHAITRDPWPAATDLCSA